MKKIKLLIPLIFIVSLLTSCYDDYIYDYEYTSTYFGSQNPLRTLVAYDLMDIEVGVALGGMRDDDGSHWVNFVIDSTLLENIPEASHLKLMPSEYYSLGDESGFNIVKDHMRTVQISFNEAILQDTLALDTCYAIPFRITNSSIDSIATSNSDTLSLNNRNISIVVVKFISNYHGHYYSRGNQIELDELGNAVDTITYYNNDLSQNDVVDFSTLAYNKVSTSRIGDRIDGSLIYTMLDDGTVNLYSDSVIIDPTSTISYNSDATTYSLDILVESDSIQYHIIEEQILRQAPEDDLRFEEW